MTIRAATRIHRATKTIAKAGFFFSDTGSRSALAFAWAKISLGMSLMAKPINAGMMTRSSR